MKDTIITGHSYKILIYNGWETEGKVMSQDSSSIKIKSKIKEYTIQKDQINAIGEPSEDISAEYEGRTSTDNDYNCRINCMNGERIDNLKLLSFNNDSLFVTNRYANMKLKVQDIKSIKFIHKSYFLPGLAAGVLVGGILGFIAGVDNSDKILIHKNDWIWSYHDIYGVNEKPLTAFLGAVCGGLLIGGIGALLGIDSEYDFTNMSIDHKKMRSSK